MPAIWQLRELRPIHFRVIFWMLDAGAIGVTPARGWRDHCAEDLGVCRQTVYAAVKKMIAWGLMSGGKNRGEAVLNPVLFECHVDRTRVKLKKSKTKGE